VKIRDGVVVPDDFPEDAFDTEPEPVEDEPYDNDDGA